MLHDQLQELCGYHLMQVGVTGEDLLGLSFRHSHKFYMDSARGTGVNLVADSEQLPLPSDTIDTAVLHHALEFSHDPHRVLSEVARVVTPGGHVILIVLNPLSFFGFVGFLRAGSRRQKIWQHQGLRQSRLNDWLRLLGLQPVRVFRGCHRLPVQLRGWLDRVQVMKPFEGKLPVGGSFYVIVARKQVAPLTPVGGKHKHKLNIPVVDKPAASGKTATCAVARRTNS